VTMNAPPSIRMRRPYRNAASYAGGFATPAQAKSSSVAACV
jgi:hypothetical protein